MRVEVVNAKLTLTNTLMQAAREMGLDQVDSNADRGHQGGLSPVNH